MKNKSFQLVEYIHWLLKKYQEVLTELETRQAYRIINIENNDHERTKLTVNIVGTGKNIQFIPEELAGDDQLLEGFSKKDVRTIIYYACANINKPKYKIIANTFCEKLRKMFFSIKKYDSNELANKTAEEISANLSVLSSLSSEDAHRIGYTYGSENILRESEEKYKLQSITK